MTGSSPGGRRFLALDSAPPPGFERCAELDTRTLRAGLVALWAPDLEPVRAHIEPLRERIRGLLITVGDEPRRERIGASLWQIQISAGAVPVLRELADAWLDVCEEFVAARRELQRTNLEVERGHADHRRLLEKVDRETEAMREKLLMRTQWTAQAMTGLVRFATDSLMALDDDELPAAIVDVLVGEPFGLAGATVLRASEGGWQTLAQAGQQGGELPAPGTCVGLTQPAPNMALLPVGTSKHEQLLAVYRPGPLDDADRSFLSLFMLMLAGNHRARELNGELLSALGQRDALIHELSSPVIQVRDDTVCLPVIGSVDHQRAVEITQVLLETVCARRIRHVIVDFTGIGLIDTHTVLRFTSLARALRMIGARCVLTGISPVVARTMVSLGIEFNELETYRSVEAALASRIHGDVER